VAAAQRARGADAVGKRVGAALYVHQDALPLLSVECERVAEAERIAPRANWNVAKIEKSSVSLLLYESFDVDFPALLHSTRVDLKSGAVTSTDYARRANPPILHRKERLLPPDDPRLPKFRALTAAAEEYGLFEESNKIGTRAVWNALIEAAGLVLRNGRLLRAEEEHLETKRHRTAIMRRDLSQPMQLLMRFGVVTSGRSVFDYGCGQGADVEALSSQGFNAFGWDPHHAPAGLRKAADVVNLGFVINVIEDPRERVETLKSAWGFALRALCVAVMPLGKSSTAAHRPFRDGFVTSRGTFQKYFDQQELRALVQSATGEPPLSFAPGIVAVFRDKDLEQEVLLRRRSRTLIDGALPRPPAKDHQAPEPRVRRHRAPAARVSARERISPLLRMLRATAIELGRLLEPDEIPGDALDALSAQRVGAQRALEMLRDDLVSDQGFARASELRRQDLLVHLALTQVPGALKYKTLPRSIQVDIKSFFRTHAAGLEEGRRLLFAAGDRAGMRADAEAAAAAGLGGMHSERSFRFKSSVLPRLPVRLRVMVGCAEMLQGGVEAAHFVDIDLEAPRVTMVTCDDVEQPLPFIVERVRVDLAKLKVSADRREPQSTPFYFKSRFLPRDEELLEGQAEFEAALQATGLFEPGQPDPPWHLVRPALEAASVKL
jgi:DNA phosphorothioation-associated putative methyltransferase